MAKRIYVALTDATDELLELRASRLALSKAQYASWVLMKEVYGGKLSGDADYRRSIQARLASPYVGEAPGA